MQTAVNDVKATKGGKNFYEVCLYLSFHLYFLKSCKQLEMPFYNKRWLDYNVDVQENQAWKMQTRNTVEDS